MKNNVGEALKSTTNKDSESSEEVDEDKEMEMFARRFKRFIRSKKGREFQKKGSSLNLPRGKIPLFSMSARNRDTSSMIVLNLKRKGLAKNGYLRLMAINDPKVTFNSSTLNDYSFDELQDAYDE
ncbi:hypothetical protein PVK06_011945 [Gossypium arboreum]|uniref:Uncharacterized protein n=1 Tax=Gossypium arboreum TaxID=29729 RepID=A0ABR0QAA1_GOSAR|nr:hypothetical protein PVK06_011945 [Gossypium arboreum]